MVGRSTYHTTCHFTLTDSSKRNESTRRYKDGYVKFIVLFVKAKTQTNLNVHQQVNKQSAMNSYNRTLFSKYNDKLLILHGITWINHKIILSTERRRSKRKTCVLHNSFSIKFQEMQSNIQGQKSRSGVFRKGMGV